MATAVCISSIRKVALFSSASRYLVTVSKRVASVEKTRPWKDKLSSRRRTLSRRPKTFVRSSGGATSISFSLWGDRASSIRVSLSCIESNTIYWPGIHIKAFGRFMRVTALCTAVNPTSHASSKTLSSAQTPSHFRPHSFESGGVSHYMLLSDDILESYTIFFVPIHVCIRQHVNMSLSRLAVSS